ncbi:MAG: ATP-binding cassette domain-containing protein [Bacteroidetes bacterium]|nr:ATP-binding cassette domain-containing protein [Bacteroidota bacterium]
MKVIQVENLSKTYDLGLVGTGTLSKDLNRTWARLRGKPDPYATLAELNDRTQKTESGTVYALKDINFSVEQGEVLGIIGKNGAGKSTLLKILSQITSPSSGDIKIKGRIASLLEVGTGMHPEMTARQNIYLNGSIMGMQRHEITRKLDEIIDFAGIGKYIDTPIKRFSSGMQVRLGFAVAAFLEPEILIVDEVLAVGDAEFQKKAVGKMKDVSLAEGRTVLFVSHNLAVVEKLCSRCFLMNHGKLEFTGSVSDGISKYLNSSELNQYYWERTDKTDSKAYFTSVKIYQDDRLDITTSGNLKVQFQYEIKEKLASLNLHLALLDSYGQVIFSSAPEDCGISKSLDKGKYSALVELPDDLLTSMSYSLKLILWDHISGSFIHYDVNEEIRLKPIETNSLINKTSGGRSGILAIKCNWKID